MTTATMQRPAAGRYLVSSELFDRLSARVAVDRQIGLPLAERICDQTLAFLKACADQPHVKLSPSEMVDIGWHTFLLYTRDYTKFCERVAGRFVHHVPEDSEHRSGVTMGETVRAIRASGFQVDTELWSGHDLQKCSQCYRGCHDS